MIPDNIEVNQETGEVIDDTNTYYDLDDYFDWLEPIDF